MISMVIIFNANSPVKAFDKTKQLCTYMYNIYMCILCILYVLNIYYIYYILYIICYI